MPYVWKCDECKKPVADGEGYLLVDRALAFDRFLTLDEAHREGSDEPVLLSDVASRLADTPPLALWHVYHHDCDPQQDRQTDYWIDVDRIRTLAQLLEWNAHLSEKNWTSATNWYRFIQNHLVK